ncbi:MAG: hypothetical protein VX225_05755, partial [Pseudomonadota bacterium]|nr:hypothetical protein [Pseudomonadota bacterium]
APEAAPEETAPEAAPEETAPEAAPEETAPEAAPEETAPEAAAPSKSSKDEKDIGESELVEAGASGSEAESN